MIARKMPLDGSGKGNAEWFSVNQANVSYDHPFHIRQEHALNLDFVNEDLGLDARVAVELTEQDARQLVATILDVLEQAKVKSGISCKRGGMSQAASRCGWSPAS
jgi:hypothetical protein